LSCSPGGGTWSSSTTSVATIGSTGLVTTISAGTTIISYTNSNGCASTKTVTVHAMPSAITGTLLVCIGNTSALASTPGGGTWTSYFTSRASINATTGLVTGVSIGTTPVTYTAPGGCSTVAIVTVGTTPAAITGSLTVCVGSTTTLNSATTGGTWSTSDGTIATVAAGIVTGISTGTATISYTNGTCFRTTTVTVNAAPGANTGTAVVCVGQGTTLSNTTGGGTWSSSNTTRATVNAATGTVAGVSAGTANISYRISASCYSITIVTVNAAPANITGTLSVCPGATTTLAHSVSGGVWTSSNTAIGTIDAGTGIATGITSGTTIITYTLGTGCFKVATLTVNTSPGAITGTANMCAGATTTLACSPSGGTWSSTTPSVATISSTGLVNGISAGNSTISYLSGTGCAATRQVTVSATPGSIGGTLSACTGSTTTLSAAPGGGTWSSSNAAIASIGSATGIVTGESTGTATITYSLSATCYVTTTATINTTPAPITGILTVCTSCNTTLSSLTGGGVWSSAATGIATIGAGTGIVFGVSTGTATISYVLGGCSRTAVVSVNAAISPSYGTPVVCVGQTNATMGNPVPGGTWSSGNTAIVTIHAANGLLTGINAGNANITYTTSPGMYTITVATVSPAVATITGTSAICPGATVTLSNATTGGAWSTTNSAIATVGAGTGVVTGVAFGTATISYFINVGCYKSITQVVNSVPNVTGASTVVNGASTTFGGSPGGGTWSSANPAIASVSGTGVVTGNSIAATTITYTLSTGCFASRGITVVTTRPSSGGAESITPQVGHIKVFPNPTSGTLTVESGISGVFTVFTIDGKEVARYAVSTQATTVSLPQHLAAGVYMCRFTGTDGTTAIVRLVYER
ncbi:MAG: Ig-like domain-containing protein, partial [Taibaiella sp.]|nr:Ig-like domain-containing protein [Taibaiella sp.]